MTNTPTPCPGEVMELAREAMLSYFRDHRTPVSVKMVAGYKNEPLEEAIARAIMADRARRPDPSLTVEIERLRARLAELVDRDLRYDGGNVIIPTPSHSHAIALVRTARAALGEA